MNELEINYLDNISILKMIYHDTHPGRMLRVGEVVKLAIRDEDVVEHLWFEITRIVRFDLYTGHCRTIPIAVNNMIYDQQIHFRFPDIEEILNDERNN